MRDLKEKLQIVRKYTGDRFAAVKGYDLRKPLSKARARTINKYFTMIMELTSTPHKVIVPKKADRRETFEFTGQRPFPRFQKAIVRTPDPDAKYSFLIDKSRPKGSRFVMVNRKTREKSWHIPAEVFLDENELLYEEDQEIDWTFFRDVIEEYAVNGQVYMIEAGDFHMWGSSGHPERVARKLADLFKQYSAGVFDRYDKHSHFIGNWFRGVQVFSETEGSKYVEERERHDNARLVERYKDDAYKFKSRHFRVLKNGKIGEFYQGQIQDSHTPIKRPYICPTCHKRFPTLVKLTRHRRRLGH